MLKKITYLNMAFGACLSTILLYVNKMEGLDKDQSDFFLLAVFTFVGMVGATTQLVGRTVAGESWAFRLSIVLSALWFLLTVVAYEPIYYDSLHGAYGFNSAFVFIGLMPLVVVWGIIWILKSVKKNNKKIMSKGIDRATFFFSLIGVTTLIFVVRNNHQYLNETVVTLALLMFVVVQGALYWQRWINIGHKGYWSLPVIVVPIVGQFAWSLYGSTMQTIVYRELLETIGTTILVLLGALAIEVTLVWFLYGLVMQTNGNRKPLDTPGTTIVFLLGVVAISGIVSSFWASGVLPKLANGNPFS